MSRDQQEAQLRLVVREYLSRELHRNVSGVGDSASLLESGTIDSVGVLELVALLEQRQGIAVSDDDMVPENFETIEAIARFVMEKRVANRG